MLVVGATIENFIYDYLNDSYLSASRFVPVGKTQAISINDTNFYSSLDTFKIQVGTVAHYKEFVQRFGDKIITSLGLEMNLVSRSNPACVIHNTSEALFPPSEIKDSYIRIGMGRYYTYKRIGNFDLHFSELGLDSEMLCDILDENLINLYNSEEPGFRKEVMGQFGRNMIKRKFMFEGQYVNGFTYKSFSTSIVRDKLFELLHKVNKSIDEYKRRINGY